MVLSSVILILSVQSAYEPTWESIDQRPNPQWFEDAKFGIFIHWGVYSVPAWAPKDTYAEWYWNHMQNKNGPTWKFHVEKYGEKFQYQDFAPMFKAELFDPDYWADVFKRSGAKYVVLTSKHHDGFCLWPSAQSWNWNSVDIGPHRDLAGDLIKAVKKVGLKAGFYYSMYEWFNPLYKEDVNRYVEEHMLPQMKDLIIRYQPDIFWPDGEWDHPSSVWRSTEFLAWLFNESPAPKDIAINDRWGRDCRNKHGGFATPEYGHIPEGHLIQEGRFEECQGMGRSFGYNRNETAENYRSTTELLHLLIDNVARGGNLLLDIGPSADGRIPEIMEERLLEMGKWLEVNGDAIYATDVWKEAPQLENFRFTRKGNAIYAIALKWPPEKWSIPKPKGYQTVPKVSLLGTDIQVPVEVRDGELLITTPCVSPAQIPCQHAWVFKLAF
ncbi:MAG: alpha-L-fucosidase [Candidatus Hydrogenedentes bacterium]|nr:alpha-L-fucosidase [Candidatus Hydrogenedentota bacterium]